MIIDGMALGIDLPIAVESTGKTQGTAVYRLRKPVLCYSAVSNIVWRVNRQLRKDISYQRKRDVTPFALFYQHPDAT